MAGPETLHATLVAYGQEGVLLRGPSGSGKSDLALRLMGLGNPWCLVSDDQVTLSTVSGHLVGRPPASIAGRMEVRGIGIVSVEHQTSARIRLIVDLVARKDVPRLPEPDETATLLGHNIPLARLHGLDTSTPLKIALLLRNLIQTPILKI